MGKTRNLADLTDSITAGNLITDSSGNIGIGTSTPDQNGGTGTFGWAIPVTTIAGSRPTLFLNSDSSIATLRLWPRGTDGSSTSVDDWHINAIHAGSGGYLKFAPQGGGLGSAGLSLLNNGIVCVGKSSGSNDVTTEGVIMQSGGKTIITNNTDVAQNLVLAHYNSTGSPLAIEFYRNSSVVGNITKSASGTFFNTTSDRRLKENIELITDGTEKVLAMKPSKFNFINDENKTTVHGFIAQEMQEIIPESVSGDDTLSMDYGRITPVVVAALQDALKEIEELKTRISELENK